MKQKLFLFFMLVVLPVAVAGVAYEAYVRHNFPADHLTFIDTVKFPELESEKWQRWYLAEYRNRDWQATSEIAAVEAFDSYLGWDHVRDGKRYRSHRTYNTIKDPGRTRVVAIGDSFTFGEQVAADASYPTQLASLLGPRSEVINMGVKGYGLDQMVMKFVKHGQTYSPDVVILGFFEPDYIRSTLSFYMGAKPRFDWNKAENRLELGFTPVPRPSEMYSYLQNQYPPTICRGCLLLKTLFQKQKALLKNSHYERDYFAKWDRIHEELLLTLQDQVDALGARLIAVYIPIGDEFESEGRVEDALASRTHQWFTSSARKFGIELVDLLEELPARHDVKTVYEDFYFPGGHFTESGNAAVAEILYSRLKPEIAKK